jgi:hypothetical protein
MSKAGCEMQQIHCDLDIDKNTERDNCKNYNDKFPLSAILALQDDTSIVIWPRGQREVSNFIL